MFARLITPYQRKNHKAAPFLFFLLSFSSDTAFKLIKSRSDPCYGKPDNISVDDVSETGGAGYISHRLQELFLFVFSLPRFCMNTPFWCSDRELRVCLSDRCIGIFMLVVAVRTASPGFQLARHLTTYIIID